MVANFIKEKKLVKNESNFFLIIDVCLFHPTPTLADMVAELLSSL
jgi:hypothetical protein